jgi:type II secretory pathway pseudopilin PulG
MRQRTAFTLVEMILVLAVLMVAFAIALPLAETLFRGPSTRAAADTVRAAIAQARTHAMEEGRSYRFGVLPGGVAYRVAPDDDSFWSGSGQGDGSSSGGAGMASQGSSIQGNMPAYIITGNIPGGIRFASRDGTAVPGPPPAPANGKEPQDPPADTIDAGKFERWIVWDSDGTSSDDIEIPFRMPGAPALILSVRGMTGVMAVRPENQQPGAPP